MVDEDPSRVVITIKDIYGEMKELIVEVRKLTQEYNKSQKVDEDHENRLRAVERWMYGIPAAVIIAVVSAIITFSGKG